MGLANPFGYVGYEVAFTELFVYLIEHFCGGCHSNEKCGGCKECPIGQLVYASKDYVENAYETSHSKDRAKALWKVKKEIKPIEPEPLMLARLRWDKRKPKYPLRKLKDANDHLEILMEAEFDLFRFQCEYETYMKNLLKEKGIIKDGTD